MWSAIEVLQILVEQLSDDTQSTTKDLLSCGPDVAHGLRLAMQSLSDLDNRQEAQLDNLIDVAYAHMSASLGSPCWRRLYTDACLLRSLADVACAVSLDDAVALESIGRLDRAIVMAGAPGEGRLDLILDSITNIQRAYLPARQVDFAILPVVVPSSLPRWLDSSLHSIPCIEPPSFGLFQKSTSLHPFIIRGYVRDWPAMQEHPWASTDYLRFVAGPGRIVPVEIGSDYRNNDWTQELMDWDDFLTALDSQGLEHRNKHDVLYLAQHNLLKQFPTLRADIIVPDYIYASLSPPVDFLGYEPPANDEQLVINAWLGPGGTVSPAHTVMSNYTKTLNAEVLTAYSEQDPYFNFYAQVVGRKTVWLAPPSVTPFMYPYPPTPLSTADKLLAHNPAANTTNPSMSNTSQVDVFASATAEQERKMHPLFWEKVLPNAFSAALEPGDLLFFPPGWWHAMRSEEKSFSVSMWF